MDQTHSNSRRIATSAVVGAVSVLLTSSAAFGQNATSKRSYLNLGGQSYPVSVSTMGGRSYISLDSLKAAGATLSNTAAEASGGANQLLAQEGVLGQTLFDGAWRFTVKSIVKSTDNYGRFNYKVLCELRNGTNAVIEPANAGIASFGAEIFLVLSNGNSVTPETDMSSPLNKDVPPGGAANFTQVYVVAKDADSPPVRVLMVIHPEKREYNGKNAHYSVKDPSFRVDLTKTASP